MKSALAKHYLLEARFEREKVPSFEKYPFSIPVLKHFENIIFHPAVTFLVGENGTGKSTFIEALALLVDLNPEGGSRHLRFTTHSTHSNLKDYLRSVRGALRPKDSFFLRAESFYNVATALDGEMGNIAQYGGKFLHEQSHGESFLSLMMNRFGGNGLYLLDEPEAALSPFRQMAMLTRMHDLVQKRSQFIIATHSPILMAYPNACIYMLSQDGIREVKYEDTEHFRVTRDFLNNHKKSLQTLLDNQTSE